MKRHPKDVRKRRITLLLAVALAIVSVLLYALVVSKPAGATETIVTCKGLSEYLGANGAIFHDKPVLQCDANIGLPGGINLNVWGSRANGSVAESFGNEGDITPSLARHIGQWTMEVGLAYYAITDPANAGLEDVLNPYIDISRAIRPTGEATNIVFVKVDHFTAVRGSLPGPGWHYHLGLRNAIPIGAGSLDSTVEVFHDTGAFNSDSGMFASVRAQLWTRPLRGFQFGPTVKWYAPITDVDDGRESDLVYGFSVRKNF